MRAARKYRRFSAFAVLSVGAVLSLGAQGLATAATAHPAAAAHPASQAVAHPGTVKPRAVGELDCNGLSPIQHPAKAAVMCKDPRGSDGGRLFENGHYIGHDEPSVRFLSSRPGSGNNFTMTETLPKDPGRRPTVKNPGKDRTHWFELSIAPWISTTVCDPNSAPLLACKPVSDSNAPHGSYPGRRSGVRGAAVLPARIRAVR